MFYDVWGYIFNVDIMLTLLWYGRSVFRAAAVECWAYLEVVWGNVLQKTTKIENLCNLLWPD